MDLLRTLLFVPGNRERMLQRAASSGADVIVIDLEDAVPRDEKAEARRALRSTLSDVAERGTPVYVRINNVHTGLARNDLMAVVRPGLAGVVHPKTEEPQDLRDLDVLLREAEVRNKIRPGIVRVIPLIETPRAVLRCDEIAGAIDRVEAVSAGGEDYCAALGVRRDAAGAALQHLRNVVVTVAAAHGLPAVDTPWTALDDEEGLVAEARLARSIGFRGKYVIHPSQVAIVNEAFTPDAGAVAEARTIVDAAAKAGPRRTGAVRLNGRMVDEPVIEQARRLVATAEAIAARSGEEPKRRSR